MLVQPEQTETPTVPRAEAGAREPETEAGCVHVVDDDHDFRQGLRLLLRSSGLAVECYLSAEHFVAGYQPYSTECALVDLRMPGMTGLELQNSLSARRIAMPIIFISGFAETQHVVQAVKRGAIDFLEKPIEADLLLARVRHALTKDRAEKQRRDGLARRLASLSNREHEVMNHLLDAKTTVEVAHRLDISPKTVEKHRSRIFEKMGVDSVPGLIRLVLG